VTFNFSDMLTEDEKERFAAEREELARLHGLPDRWLGEALLKLARQAREENPRLLRNPSGDSYSPAFVWHVIPEVAKRLGCRVDLNEARAPDIVSLSDRELRETVGHFLANATLNYGLDICDLHPLDNKPRAIDLLEHEACNGNPVAMAIDRICPPAPEGQDQDDRLARRIREAGRYVDGVQVAMWSPEAVTKSEMEAETSPPRRMMF
jgi:hypothetical protein